MYVGLASCALRSIITEIIKQENSNGNPDLSCYPLQRFRLAPLDRRKNKSPSYLAERLRMNRRSQKKTPITGLDRTANGMICWSSNGNGPGIPDPAALLAKRASGQGWGAIWKDLKLIGNEKDVKTPPGQLMKLNHGNKLIFSGKDTNG